LVQVSNIDDYRQQKAPQSPRSPVERLLADARLRLVETGTRNRLVHTPRGGKRMRSLPIIDSETDRLFETLVRSNKIMRFLSSERNRELALDDPSRNAKHSLAPGPVPTSLRTNLEEEKLESVFSGYIAMRKPPRRSKASTSSFSRSDSCAGLRTTSPLSCAKPRLSSFRCCERAT
jgi:hypothetical protein